MHSDFNTVIRGKGLNIGERFIALTTTEKIVRSLLQQGVEAKCQPGFYYVLNTTRNALEASFLSKHGAMKYLNRLTEGDVITKHSSLRRVDSDWTLDETDKLLRLLDEY